MLFIKKILFYNRDSIIEVLYFSRYWCWNEIVSLNSSYLGPQHSTTLRNQGLLDVLISRADKFEEAEAAVKLSLSASEWNSLPPDKPTTLYSSLEKLEKMYAGRFDILGHERILKCKLDYLDRCAPGDPALATVLTDYSNLLFRTGRFDQAKQLAERAATFKPRMGV